MRDVSHPASEYLLCEGTAPTPTLCWRGMLDVEKSKKRNDLHSKLMEIQALNDAACDSLPVTLWHRSVGKCEAQLRSSCVVVLSSPPFPYTAHCCLISPIAVRALMPESTRFCHSCWKISTFGGKVYKLTKVHHCTLMLLKSKSINFMITNGIWHCLSFYS